MAVSRVQIAAISILAVAAGLGNYLRASNPPDPGPLPIAMVMTDSLEYTEEPVEQDFLDVLKAQDVVFRTYESPSPVWVFLGYFNQQKEGSQVHSPRHCYPGSGWSILDEGVSTPRWSEAELTTLVVSNGQERRLVWYWFETPDGILSDVFDLKLYLTKNAILRKPQEVVFVRVSTAIGDSRGTAGVRLGGYADRLHGDIAKLFEMNRP